MCINLLHKDLWKVSLENKLHIHYYSRCNKEYWLKICCSLGTHSQFLFQRVGLDNKPFKELICMLSLIILPLKTSKYWNTQDAEISNFKLYNTSFKWLNYYLFKIKFDASGINMLIMTNKLLSIALYILYSSKIYFDQALN